MGLTVTTWTPSDAARPCTVVGLRGEVDVYTAPALRERFLDVVRTGGHHLVVDLDRVDFLDSTGLGVLVGVLKRVRSHQGSLRLVVGNERILKVFRISGLTKVFSIHAGLEEALAAGARGDLTELPTPARKAG